MTKEGTRPLPVPAGLLACFPLAHFSRRALQHPNARRSLREQLAACNVRRCLRHPSKIIKGTFTCAGQVDTRLGYNPFITSGSGGLKQPAYYCRGYRTSPLRSRVGPKAGSDVDGEAKNVRQHAWSHPLSGSDVVVYLWEEIELAIWILHRAFCGRHESCVMPKLTGRRTAKEKALARTKN